MRWLALVALLGGLGGGAMAAEVQVIDDFEYPDAAALNAAWESMNAFSAAELMPHEAGGGTTAMKIPCPFTQEMQRGSFDRRVNLDLMRAGSIAFDFYVDDPAPISYCAIYFHSRDGWFGTSFGVSKGWQRVVLGKGAFGIEEQPAGWDQIDTIRISAWKGRAQDTFCAIDNLEARTEDIAIVRGLSPGGENETARNCAEQAGAYLTAAGLPHGILTDKDVEGGALGGHRLAIFTYSPSLTPAAISAIQDFVAGGGKIMVFYTLPDALRELLGVADLSYSRESARFARIVFDQAAVPGLPPGMGQGSWNANVVAPGGHNARIIGTWQGADGQNNGGAVVLSDNGLYMGHIMTADDAANKQAFLLAAIGYFLPEAWRTMAEAAVNKSLTVGPFRTEEDLVAFLEANTPDGPRGDEMRRYRQQAAEAAQRADNHLQAGEYPQVIVAAAARREALVNAYLLAHRPRACEFRAVWNHSGSGDCGTWDEAMRRLKEAGFNAVVPNMWWGGVAHYDSKLLPLSATFREKGDQIAQCVEAGKKYGIEVHPWKVNWNLSTAPPEFVAQMRAEKRLQANWRGEEEAWLCPSNPANFQLELDTMLEVVRNYDVDGVHFDYIRYPHGENCYCDGCRERFEADRGAAVVNWPADCYNGPLRAEYRQWRCDNITRLVRATAEQARQIKPWIKISAAVFSDYPACKDSVGQDWVLWCREGYLDFVCPMNYTESDTRFQNIVTNQVSLVGGAVPVYSGIGQFIIPDDQVVGQMELARSLGADGFILFNMGTGLAEQGLPRYAMSMTASPAILPHNAPVIRFRTRYDTVEAPIEVAEDELVVTVELRGFGQHRKRATDVDFAVELQDTAGARLAALDVKDLGDNRYEVRVQRQTQTARVAAVGTLTFEDGTTAPFVVRSRTYAWAAGK